jgi:hypothetical protein
MLLPWWPLKTMLAIKIVKIDSKILATLIYIYETNNSRKLTSTDPIENLIIAIL